MSDSTPPSVTVIAPGTRVLGGLVADGDLVVAGVVEGPVVGAANVRLEPGAAVRGEVRGRDVVIAGALAAPVTAAASVRLLPTAEVHGDIEAPRVVIDDGALLEGAVRMVQARTRVDMPALKAPPPAVVAPASPPQRALSAPSTTTPPPAPSKPVEQRAVSREIPDLPALGRRAIARRQ
jgi:cytoskeletal protein CcmA (bactofilin family)